MSHLFVQPKAHWWVEKSGKLIWHLSTQCGFKKFHCKKVAIKAIEKCLRIIKKAVCWVPKYQPISAIEQLYILTSGAHSTIQVLIVSQTELLLDNNFANQIFWFETSLMIMMMMMMMRNSSSFADVLHVLNEVNKKKKEYYRQSMIVCESRRWGG